MAKRLKKLKPLNNEGLKILIPAGASGTVLTGLTGSYSEKSKDLFKKQEVYELPYAVKLVVRKNLAGVGTKKASPVFTDLVGTGKEIVRKLKGTKDAAFVENDVGIAMSVLGLIHKNRETDGNANTASTEPAVTVTTVTTGADETDTFECTIDEDMYNEFAKQLIGQQGLGFTGDDYVKLDISVVNLNCSGLYTVPATVLDGYLEILPLPQVMPEINPRIAELKRKGINSSLIPAYRTSWIFEDNKTATSDKIDADICSLLVQHSVQDMCIEYLVITSANLATLTGDVKLWSRRNGGFEETWTVAELKKRMKNMGLDFTQALWIPIQDKGANGYPCQGDIDEGKPDSNELVYLHLENTVQNVTYNIKTKASWLAGTDVAKKAG